MTATPLETWIVSGPPLEMLEGQAVSGHRRERCTECQQGVPCLDSFGPQDGVARALNDLNLRGH